MKVKLESFSIIGIEARTNNASEMGPNGIIPKQWDRFLKENILERIPSQTDRGVIAGYTEYQSNKDGDYTFIIGTKVNSTESIPEGMVAKVVSAGNYIVLTSEKGPIWEVVQALWKKIWNAKASEDASESNRAYAFDYEVYDMRAADPMSSQVDVFIGVI